MPVDHSEFRIFIKLVDAATPRLFSEDASVFDGTQLAADAGGGVPSVPEELITFVFGKITGKLSTISLSIRTTRTLNFGRRKRPAPTISRLARCPD